VMVLKVVVVATGWIVSNAPPTGDTTVVVLIATVTNFVTVTVLVSVIVTTAGFCDNAESKSIPAKVRRPDRLILGAGGFGSKEGREGDEMARRENQKLMD
jgi:hypothetical protein